jgi:hypothetical protein
MLDVSYPLLAHPAFPAPADLGLTINVDISKDGALGLCFACDCLLGEVLIPEPIPPCRRDELWRHTCCELFLAAGDGRYREFNFSPSQAWAAYDFSRYRQRTGALPEIAVPDIRFARNAGGWELKVAMPETSWRGFHRIGVTAVIESPAGDLSYWALKHPAEKPDFHDPNGFSITLAAFAAAPNKS